MGPTGEFLRREEQTEGAKFSIPSLVRSGQGWVTLFHRLQSHYEQKQVQPLRPLYTVPNHLHGGIPREPAPQPQPPHPRQANVREKPWATGSPLVCLLKSLTLNARRFPSTSVLLIRWAVSRPTFDPVGPAPLLLGLTSRPSLEAACPSPSPFPGNLSSVCFMYSTAFLPAAALVFVLFCFLKQSLTVAQADRKLTM